MHPSTSVPAHRFLRSLVCAVAVTLLLCGTAHAAGSGMPWEAPLQRILESIEGPVAKVCAVVIIVVTGLSLAFGDMGGGIRRLAPRPLRNTMMSIASTMRMRGTVTTASCTSCSKR